MLDTESLGKMAAELHKQALKYQRARVGRLSKGTNSTKQLQAAGSPRMTTPGVFAFPRGRAV